MGQLPPPQLTLVKHLVLAPTVFMTGQEVVEIWALVDLGAMANFMDSSFAAQWSILQQEVSPLVLLETIDDPFEPCGCSAETLSTCTLGHMWKKHVLCCRSGVVMGS